MNRPITSIQILAISLALLCWKGSASTLSPGLKRAEAIFPCPLTDELCAFSSGSQPQRLPLIFPKSTFKEALRLGEDRFAALLRGHQEPGRVVIASMRGAVQGVRELSMPRPLEAMAAVSDSGRAILCGGGESSDRCDMWLLPVGAAQIGDLFSVDSVCLYPTFLGNGDLVCWENSGAAALVTIDHQTGRAKRVQIANNSEVDQVIAISSGAAWLLSGQELFVSSEGSRYKLSHSIVLWLLARSAGRAAMGECRYAEDRPVECSVNVLEGQGGIQRIWRSASEVPVSAFSLGDSGLAIDVAGPRSRKIIGFDKRNRSQIFWSSSAKK